MNSCLVPLRSVQDIYCHEITAFTIFIKWLRAPKAYMQGIRTGYNLYYRNSTHRLNITNIAPQRESITVIGLEPNTWFHFQLGAMTSMGEGNKSENISCKTKMSGRRENLLFIFRCNLDIQVLLLPETLLIIFKKLQRHWESQI